MELCKVLETDTNPCPDYACSSALMNAFEHWTNTNFNNAIQAQAKNDILERGGQDRTQDEGLWIYRTQEQLKSDELQDIWGLNKVGKCLTWLKSVDVIDIKSNPEYKWDRTKQYLFNYEFVNDRFTELEIAFVNSKDSIDQNQSIEGDNSKDSSIKKTNKKNTLSPTVDGDENPKPKVAKRDIIKDWVAKHIFDVDPDTVPKDLGFLVGNWRNAVVAVHKTKGTDCTLKHLNAWRAWYDETYPDIDYPQDRKKVSKSYTRWYDMMKKQATAKPSSAFTASEPYNPPDAIPNVEALEYGK